MSHLWVLPVIATVVIAALAAVAVRLLQSWISRSRRTFELRAKDGRKVTFQAGEDEDVSAAVSYQLSRLEQERKATY
jgi:hypothetical protein